MRITARGFGLLAAATVLLGTGFGFDYPELVLLGSAAAVSVGCALVNAAWRPRLMVARAADPDRVGRGEPASMTLTIRNSGRLRPANLLAEDRCGGATVPVPVLRLRPGRDTTVSYPVPTLRRGVVPVGPLRVTRRDALGLVALTRSYGDSVPVWVHPRVHPLTAVPTGVARSLDGRIDRVPHGSITFDSLREYVVGDELRRVHWRTSARVGELMVREHLDTSLPRIVVLLDNRAHAHPGLVNGVAESFEAACEAAASVITAACRDDLPVILLLVVPSGTISAAAGTPSVGAATPAGTVAADDPVPVGMADRAAGNPLDRLAAADLVRGGLGDPLRTVTTWLRQERLGDTLVFLTGPAGRNDLGYLGALRGAYPSVVVGVLGAHGAAPSGTGGLIVIDAADGARFATEWDGVRRW